MSLGVLTPPPPSRNHHVRDVGLGARAESGVCDVTRGGAPQVTPSRPLPLSFSVRLPPPRASFSPPPSPSPSSSSLDSRLVLSSGAFILHLLLFIMSAAKQGDRKGSGEWHEFFWNPRTHELLGRTAASWGESRARAHKIACREKKKKKVTLDLKSRFM